VAPANEAPPAAVAAQDDALPEGAVQSNPTGRQEPAVSLEWLGPPLAKVGQTAEYTLAVRNACSIPVQQVLVRVRIPAGMVIASTEPRTAAEGNVLVWELGTLAAKQQKDLQMKLVAQTKGDLVPQAWVTFTGSSVMQIRVREPRLVLKAAAPERVVVGDACAFTLTASNPGDGAADQVKIHAELSDGLEHARGSRLDFEIGSLGAGESRSVQLFCATKAGGPQKCSGSADADGGLRSADAAGVTVTTPRLEVQLGGPALRYLERKALYTLRVTNPGDAPATNVTVGDVVPAGFKVLAATDGGRYDASTRTVSWFLGEIPPGQSREVKLEAQAVGPGEQRHRALAFGARGVRAESELATRVDGLPALLLEMTDTEDPVEVNGDTAYEVRLTNAGSKPESDIHLVATVPEKMEFRGAQGPVHYRQEGRTVVFEPLEKLPPRGEAVFRVHVKAREPGVVCFKIEVTSATLQEPVVKMEATRIYSDAPEAAPGKEIQRVRNEEPRPRP
jgi:uncharacterized repeat protein (TIGR01451 family)